MLTKGMALDWGRYGIRVNGLPRLLQDGTGTVALGFGREVLDMARAENAAWPLGRYRASWQGPPCSWHRPHRASSPVTYSMSTVASPAAFETGIFPWQPKEGCEDAHQALWQAGRGPSDRSEDPATGKRSGSCRSASTAFLNDRGRYEGRRSHSRWQPRRDRRDEDNEYSQRGERHNERQDSFGAFQQIHSCNAATDEEAGADRGSY